MPDRRSFRRPLGNHRLSDAVGPIISRWFRRRVQRRGVSIGVNLDRGTFFAYRRMILSVRRVPGQEVYGPQRVARGGVPWQHRSRGPNSP
jgi:hypothetical protein